MYHPLEYRDKKENDIHVLPLPQPLEPESERPLDENHLSEGKSTQEQTDKPPPTGKQRKYPPFEDFIQDALKCGYLHHREIQILQERFESQPVQESFHVCLDPPDGPDLQKAVSPPSLDLHDIRQICLFLDRLDPPVDPIRVFDPSDLHGGSLSLEQLFLIQLGFNLILGYHWNRREALLGHIVRVMGVLGFLRLVGQVGHVEIVMVVDEIRAVLPLVVLVPREGDFLRVLRYEVTQPVEEFIVQGLPLWVMVLVLGVVAEAFECSSEVLV